MKPILRIAAASALLLLPIACGCRPTASDAGTPEAAASDRQARSTGVPQAIFETDPAEGRVLTIRDGLGRSVTLNSAPTRIVSLAPKNTEMLFALGAGEHVIGVTSYCNFPPEASSREIVGGVAVKSLNLEKVVSLQPDLIFTAGRLHEPVIGELERLGFTVIALAGDSISQLRGELELIAEVTGRSDEARPLIDRIDERVASVRTRAAEIPDAERVSVFYQVTGEPLMAAGPESYLGEMISLCGGVNIVEDVGGRYPRISHEVLLARDPQVIISTTDQRHGFSEENLQRLPGWSGLRAVKNGRIHLLDADLISRCGPRLADALEEMAAAIYPEHFASQDASEPTP